MHKALRNLYDEAQHNEHVADWLASMDDERFILTARSLYHMPDDTIKAIFMAGYEVEINKLLVALT